MARKRSKARTPADESALDESVPGETIPGEMPPGESIPGEMPPGETAPAEAGGGAAPAAPALVVGVGASAGGLGPIRTLLAQLKHGCGLAVVLVQHLGVGGDALLAAVGQTATPFKVIEAADGMPLRPDHVYVASGRGWLAIVNGTFTMQDVTQCSGLRMPADHFFCALAADQGRRSVGIVLSGTGADGTAGLAEIRASGGAAFVQDPQTAEFPDMPANAIAAGHADAVLPPEGMAARVSQRLAEIVALTAQQEEEAGLEAVLLAVRNMTGHDFHCYKRATLSRRTRRRLGLHHLTTFDDYARLLRTDKDEAALLRKDLLIGVTEFFRQPEAWHVLEEKVVADLIQKTQPESTLRVWVPACSIGKEAYSVAMLLVEAIERSGKPLALQVFATDADATAVDIARRGVYAEEDLAGLSPARLERFCARKNGQYEFVKALRSLVVFAPQDLTTDPPFSRLDLVTCRNLLIYLDQAVQRKIIQLMHFALRDGGYLFLGAAETVCGQDNLFEPVSPKWRIYRKLGVTTPVRLDLPLRPQAKPAVAVPVVVQPPRLTLPSIAHQALAERFAPAAAVVDRKGMLLYMHGDVEAYLQLTAGEHTGLLADAVREGLKNRLTSAILQTVAEGKRVAVQARVRKGKKTTPVKITVSPLRHPREAEGLLLVTFETQKAPKASPPAANGEPAHSDIRQLEDELKITREELSSTIEQLEQSNEHLKASNEEVTAANEELQSANEELETSKEELQSVNEELNAVNTRLQEKVVELEQAGNDVANLLASGNIATVFLDKELKVRRFTQAVTGLLSLVETDMGRPLADIHRKVRDDALLADARRVLVDLAPATAEVQAEDGAWYNRRILPYRTRDDRIEGVVITFSDVTELKELAEALRVSETQARWLGRFPEENPNPVLRVAADGTVLYQNPVAASLPGWRCVVGDPLPQEALRHLVGKAMADGQYAEQDVEMGGTYYAVAVAPIPVECYANVYGRDVTERKAAGVALAASERKYRELVETANSIIIRWDNQGIIRFINDFGLRFFGYTSDELLGRDVMTIVPKVETGTGRDLEALVRDIVVHPGQYTYVPSENVRKDGTAAWVAWTNKATLDEQGNAREILAIGNDITELKRAEESVSRSRKTFSELVESAPFGIYTVDSRFRIAQMNMGSQTGAFLNVRPVIGRDFAEAIRIIWPEPVAAEIIAVFRHTLDTGEPYYSPRFTNRRLDVAAVESYEWELHRMTLPDGQYGVVCYYFDSTRLREAEAALRESEARLKVAEAVHVERQRLYDVLETLPVYVILLDADYRVPFANRFFRERFGESGGNRCYEYLFNRAEPCEICETYTVMKTGKPHHWYWTGPDGRDYDIYDYPFTDADGSSLILEMGIDITERKRAEAALAQAGAYNRSLIEASLDPLVTIGSDGRITDVNASTEQATGLRRDELVGTDFSSYFTEPDQARAGYQQVFREGLVRDYPLELRHRDGRTTPVLYNATVYRNADGEVLGVFAAARDVTERRRAETALQEAHDLLERRVAERTAELARSNADLEQFARVASHDLQEPLRMISGFMKLIQERYDPLLDDTGREYIGYSVEGAIRMSQLITDLLTYSRVTSKGMAPQAMDAGQALAAALANLRSSIQEAKAAVTYDALPAVHADPSQLAQVFQNLVGNAVKFCATDRPCQVHVGAEKREGYWVLSVRDNGIGIPPEALDRVFVIFQRLHTRDKYPGTGIGLAICKKIIERHGGRIWIESTPGEGSTFHFTLPEAGA